MLKACLPSALKGGYVQSVPCECPNRAGCVLNRAFQCVITIDLGALSRRCSREELVNNVISLEEFGGFCSLVVTE